MLTHRETVGLVGLGAVMVGLFAYLFLTGRDDERFSALIVDGPGPATSPNSKANPLKLQTTILSRDFVPELSGELSPECASAMGLDERLEDLKRRFDARWSAHHLLAEDWQVALELMAALEMCGDIDTYFLVVHRLSMDIDSSSPSNGLMASLSWIRVRELTGTIPSDDVLSDCERFLRAGASYSLRSPDTLSYVRERRSLYADINSSRLDIDKASAFGVGCLIVIGYKAVDSNEEVLASVATRLRIVMNDDAVPKLERMAIINFLLSFCSASSTPEEIETLFHMKKSLLRYH